MDKPFMLTCIPHCLGGVRHKFYFFSLAFQLMGALGGGTQLGLHPYSFGRGH